MIDRRHFQRATPGVLEIVYPIWKATNYQILQFIAQPNSFAANQIQSTLIACKLSLQTIRPLLLKGLNSIFENNYAVEFLTELLPSLQQIINFRT